MQKKRQLSPRLSKILPWKYRMRCWRLSRGRSWMSLPRDYRCRESLWSSISSLRASMQRRCWSRQSRRLTEESNPDLYWKRSWLQRRLRFLMKTMKKKSKEWRKSIIWKKIRSERCWAKTKQPKSSLWMTLPLQKQLIS